jgi:hypothetical protein
MDAMDGSGAFWEISGLPQDGVALAKPSRLPNLAPARRLLHCQSHGTILGGAVDAAVEAGAALGVTAAAATLVHAQDEGVLVAVGRDLDDFLELAAGGALVPELLAAAAVVHRLAELQGLAQGFGIHVGEHERRTGVGIHRHGRDEAVLVELRGEGQTLLDALFRVAPGELEGGSAGHDFQT